MARHQVTKWEATKFLSGSSGTMVAWTDDALHDTHTTHFLSQEASLPLSGHAKMQLNWLNFVYVLIIFTKRFHTLGFSSKATAE